jgi:hypothetical protein
MEDNSKERLAFVVISIILVMVALGMYDENLKLQLEIKNGSIHALNVPAPVAGASCPTLPTTTVTVYRERIRTIHPASTAPLLSGRDEKCGDWERANELAKQADDIVSAVRNQ